MALEGALEDQLLGHAETVDVRRCGELWCGRDDRDYVGGEEVLELAIFCQGPLQSALCTKIPFLCVGKIRAAQQGSRQFSACSLAWGTWALANRCLNARARLVPLPGISVSNKALNWACTLPV